MPGWVRIQYFLKTPALEQVELDNPQHTLHRPAITRTVPCNRHQQIGNHGNPQLRQHSVARGADKRLDLQVLLDRFEEQLNLPAILVNSRNRLRRPTKMIGQKLVKLARLRITVANTTQQWRSAFERMRAVELNDLITADTRLAVGRPALLYCINRLCP